MKNLRRSERGDSIVEVLIAIAIMSLVLAVSYVTANRNYKTMTDAQERGVAQKLMERQLEALKTYNLTGTGHAALFPSAPHNFCLTVSGATITKSTNGGPNNPCVFDENAQVITVAGQEPAYSVTINPITLSGSSVGAAPGGQLFRVAVAWDSVLGDGVNTEQLEYGLY